MLTRAARGRGGFRNEANWAGLLCFSEVFEGFGEGPFGGDAIAHHEGEAREVVRIEGGGFEASSAAAEPELAGEVLDDHALVGGGRGVFGDEVIEEELEDRGVFAFDEKDSAGESVFNSVARGGGFAGFSSGSRGAGRVGAIGFDLRLSGHGILVFPIPL